MPMTISPEELEARKLRRQAYLQGLNGVMPGGKTIRELAAQTVQEGKDLLAAEAAGREAARHALAEKQAARGEGVPAEATGANTGGTTAQNASTTPTAEAGQIAQQTASPAELNQQGTASNARTTEQPSGGTSAIGVPKRNP